MSETPRDPSPAADAGPADGGAPPRPPRSGTSGGSRVTSLLGMVSFIGGLLLAALAVAAAAFTVVLLVIKLAWAWVVPDLAPGAVETGLVAGELSWWSAFKVAIVVAILGAIIRAATYRGGRDQRFGARPDPD